MILPIASLDDPRLAPFRQLKPTNETRRGGLFVAEGLKLVERLLASPFPVDRVLCADSHLARIAPLLPEDVPLYTLPTADVDRLVGFKFHRGVMAAGRRVRGPTVASLLETAVPRQTWVVLPDVIDPENVGAILRTSAAFGADAVVLGREACDPFSRRVLRTSMGAVLRLPVVETTDLSADLHLLRDAGFDVVATVLDPAAESLHQATRPSRLALLLGNEGHGLGPQWLAECTRRWTIPMHTGVDSLNVALAAGILLYEVCGCRSGEPGRTGV